MHFPTVENFHQWRTEARRLLALEVSPPEINWNADASQPALFGNSPREPLEEHQKSGEADQTKQPKTAHRVPAEFLSLAETVACHRLPTRWELLYRTLWRMTHGERQVLEIVTDDDIDQLFRMRKQITRDVHKMKAFVRFRKVVDEQKHEHYVAWHRPDHRIVPLAAPFFSRRFGDMHWSIFTPDESVTWDCDALHYGPGIPASEAPQFDELEDLWKTYYASTFNPARIKVAAMKNEMPVRHWRTMPETELIPDLLAAANQRVNNMLDRQEGFHQTAIDFMPPQTLSQNPTSSESLSAPSPASLDSLRAAAQCCTACDLHQFATQTVFGVGPSDAKIVFIGEQPGDREDLAGQPFLGPAGQLLDRLLEKADIARKSIYITNVVKHFKFVERGKQRLHKKPNSREIFACRPWLEAELEAIQPQAIVCLGATPAQALFGRDFRISTQRGLVSATEWCSHSIATWHPAAILRMPDAARREQMENELVADLSTLPRPTET
jgi:DNA polymerase